jgi:hypothetical protein
MSLFQVFPFRPEEPDRLYVELYIHRLKLQSKERGLYLPVSVFNRLGEYLRIRLNYMGRLPLREMCHLLL